jgi:hypothetical protein
MFDTIPAMMAWWELVRWLMRGGYPARLEPWQPGFAVRRDWPDGTHDLVGFRTTALQAHRFAERDRRYWRWGPLRPRAWAVVVVSRRDFDLHAGRRDCRAPDCPAAPTPRRRHAQVPPTSR